MDKRQPSKSKSAISPIIATLLLILIAIAAGVVLYAYVQGFIANSTQNTGTSQSTVTIDSSCVSTGGSSCNGKGYFVVVRNLGTNTIASGSVVQIYFTDVSASVSGITTFTLASSISPGGSATLSGTLPTFTGTVTSGDTITVKIAMPDGGSATATVKAF